MTNLIFFIDKGQHLVLSLQLQYIIVKIGLSVSDFRFL